MSADCEINLFHLFTPIMSKALTRSPRHIPVRTPTISILKCQRHSLQERISRRSFSHVNKFSSSVILREGDLPVQHRHVHPDTENLVHLLPDPGDLEDGVSHHTGQVDNAAQETYHQHSVPDFWLNFIFLKNIPAVII